MRTGTAARSPRGLIEVSVLAGGAPQEIYRRNDGMLFVAGTAGQAYTLRVRNLVSSRVEVIGTVDGRHTLKDEPGDAEQNRGLVFAANSTGDFTGWRISDAETRQFVFGTPERSVSAQATGSQANVGTVGFAAYREREVPRVRTLDYGYLPMTGNPNVVPCCDSAVAGAVTTANTSGGVQTRGLGTGIGAVQADHVSSTTFTRDSAVPDVLVIGYDTREALEAMGITGAGEPNAFPGATTGYEQYANA